MKKDSVKQILSGISMAGLISGIVLTTGCKKAESGGAQESGVAGKDTSAVEAKASCGGGSCGAAMDSTKTSCGAGADTTAKGSCGGGGSCGK